MSIRRCRIEIYKEEISQFGSKFKSNNVYLTIGTIIRLSKKRNFVQHLKRQIWDEDIDLDLNYYFQ